jgi:Putative Actinobacterial Holin-X, holin superfamily III
VEEDMENKSIGGALVDVFDAGVSLVKTEISLVTRRVGNIAKAKGLGVLLLVAALVPLTLALVFLILFVFYGLERLGLAAWSAALIMGLFSLIVTAALIFIGLKRLGADVADDAPPPAPLSDVEKDDLKYGASKRVEAGGAFQSNPPTSSAAPYRTASGQETTAEVGHTTGGHQAAPTRPNVPSAVISSTSTPGSTSTPSSTSTPGPDSETQNTAPQGTSTQGTSTQGKPSSEANQKGVEVSTHPTYKEDMKKEGY